MAETARNHIFFKRNQSSDNRSHGFGAKFLLKKLSASDFSYERKSAFRIVLRQRKSLHEIEVAKSDQVDSNHRP